MNGHIRKRGKNSWQILFEAAPRDSDGKRNQKWETVRGSKRDAQRRLREILAAMDQGSYVEPTRITLAEYLTGWLSDHALPNLTRQTHERYQEIVRLHLIPALGNHPVAKLQPVHIQHYYTHALTEGRKDRVGGLSPTTVLQHHRILRRALQQALRLQLIARNPADAVEPPRKRRSEMKVLTDEESRTLIRILAGTRLEAPVIIALTTGMRRGEVLGLRWSDLDLDEATATIQQALESTKDGLHFKSPKTDNSRRRIDLLHFLVEKLKQHRTAQAKRRLLLGPAYKDLGLVCPAPDGRPWHPDTLSSLFRKFLERHSLPRVRFHDLRHTHATSLLRQNIHPKVVSERLGHGSISITLDTYSHVLPGMGREAADKLDVILNTEED